jgi:flavin reductase (DIM6/NTAB) family NADH-FMN oxidoreductase RutF
MKKLKLDPGPFVFPMPVALVGAVVNGKTNFMTAAFAGIVNVKPPVVACGLNPAHHTCDGILENGVFSLNLPDPDLVVETDWCGLYSGKKHDKSGIFDTFTGELPAAPMIDACRLTAQCRLLDTVPFEVDTVFFGEVVSIFIDDDAVTETGGPDWRKINPLLFTFPDKGYWKLGVRVADAWRIGKTFTP